jgi:hypothetical protein
VKVELSDEAKQQARKINAWWRANRDAKGLFKEELAAAVRRFLLKRTSHHLYYVIDEERGVVRVAAIWGAARGSGPPL